MLGLHRANAHRRQIPSPTEVRRAPLGVMSVGCQDMDAPLVQHSMRPVLRSSAKSARE
jgi:hypothetical protein